MTGFITWFYYGNYYEKHKGSGTSCQFSFRLPITFRSFLSLMIHNQAIFDASIQIDFWNSKKTKIGSGS